MILADFSSKISILCNRHSNYAGYRIFSLSGDKIMYQVVPELDNNSAVKILGCPDLFAYWQETSYHLRILGYLYCHQS